MNSFIKLEIIRAIVIVIYSCVMFYLFDGYYKKKYGVDK